ncbi:matrixin family metalloprotease [Nocardioides sp. Soil805]|uniref:matrixin family metalloprotease n=1 Tax=Nocardioides sp. Soil805 TaxID=1736416 RepID=UPI000702B327|nr:matrixin family metalloprotease [Nocardioides sp. Soil805]
MPPTARSSTARPSVRRRSAAAGVATTALVAGLLAGAPADAGRPARTKTTASWSSTSTVRDTPVSVTGTVKDRVRGRRTVRLQLRTASGWRTQEKARTTSAGDYSFAVPTWWTRSAKVRVLAARTGRARADATRAQRVTVVEPYAAGGDPAAWAHISSYPVRLNPCQRLTYRVNAAQGLPDPATAETLSHAAIARISQATGVEFRYLGPTGAVFQGGGGSVPKDTDVLISWATDAETALDIGPGTAGRGGAGKAVWGRDARGRRIALARNAGVVIDSQTPYMDASAALHVLMHELGHAMGLGHVSDPAQVMHPASYDVPDYQWGAGDLTGFEKVGTMAGCVRPDRRGRFSAPGGLQLPDLP